MKETHPIVGVTTDVSEADGRVRLGAAFAYAQCLARAGATPVLLPPLAASIDEYLDVCRGFVFTGGDDPRMEPFGGATHSKATPVHPLRQEFETALLSRLERERHRPVLGICLGMQMMCLYAGGEMNQHLPDDLPTHADHWGREHPVRPEPRFASILQPGVVASRHRQAMRSAGSLTPAATSHDGVLEAVIDPARRFYLGVQWHPERTGDQRLGQEIFDRFVESMRA